MLHRFNGATAKLAHTKAAQPLTRTSVTKAARGLLSTAQHTLTFVGLSALAVVAVLFARPEMAAKLSHVLAPPAPAVVAQAARTSTIDVDAMVQRLPAAEVATAPVAPLTADEKAMQVNKKQQQFVTTWLSKRYRVAGDATNMLVATAYVTARDIKLDPLLILAVMAIESGLNPFAESAVGAQGLMQVMSKIHHAKFARLGGQKAAFNPAANIRVGSEILKEYVKRGGSVEAGLKTYVGAAAFETDQGYGHKVLAEYQRLKLVATGKSVPTYTKHVAPAPAPAAVAAEKAAMPQPEAAPAPATGDQLASLE